jgi:hypothetical protein
LVARPGVDVRARQRASLSDGMRVAASGSQIVYDSRDSFTRATIPLPVAIRWMAVKPKEKDVH